jgi:hypothetical protein
MAMECFQLLAERRKRLDNCSLIAYHHLEHHHYEEPSPMWIRESDKYVQLNWVAIFSYTASLAVSLAIWRGLFRAVQLLVK